MKFKLNKKIILIIGAIVLLLIIYFFSKNKKEVIPSPTTPPVSSYNNLELGSASRDDVVKNLGQPDDEYQQDGNTIIEYLSKNPNFNNQLIIKDDKLNFVKEIITLDDNLRIKDIEDKFGKAQEILYGPDAPNGFYLYIYPNNGIAYIGHETSGLIKEVWHFKPTDFQTFKDTYAPFYTEEPEFVQ